MLHTSVFQSCICLTGNFLGLAMVSKYFMAAPEQLLINERQKNWSHQICWCWPVKRVSIPIRSRAALPGICWTGPEPSVPGTHSRTLSCCSTPAAFGEEEFLPKEAVKNDSDHLKHLLKDLLSKIGEWTGPSTHSPGGLASTGKIGKGKVWEGVFFC